MGIVKAGFARPQTEEEAMPGQRRGQETRSAAKSNPVRLFRFAGRGVIEVATRIPTNSAGHRPLLLPATGRCSVLVMNVKEPKRAKRRAQSSPTATFPN